jgi:hypothetical protein
MVIDTIEIITGTTMQMREWENGSAVGQRDRKSAGKRGSRAVKIVGQRQVTERKWITRL